MKAAAAVLLAVAMVASGCVGTDDGTSPSAVDGNGTDDDATNRSGVTHDGPMGPNGTTYAGYSPQANATVQVDPSDELEFSIPAGGYVEAILEVDEETWLQTRGYTDGDGEHPVGPFGLLLLHPSAGPADADAETSCADPIDAGSWWVGGAAFSGGNWSLDEGSHVLLAWGNGGEFSLTFEESGSDDEPRRIEPAEVDLTGRRAEADVETASGTGWEASFDTEVEPGDWTFLGFQTSRFPAPGPASAESTVVSETGAGCASASESTLLGNAMSISFGLQGGSGPLQWWGNASYQASPAGLGDAEATAVMIDHPG